MCAVVEVTLGTEVNAEARSIDNGGGRNSGEANEAGGNGESFHVERLWGVEV